MPDQTTAPAPAPALKPFGPEILADLTDLAFIEAKPLDPTRDKQDGHPVRVGYKAGLVQTFTGDAALEVRAMADAIRAEALAKATAPATTTTAAPADPAAPTATEAPPADATPTEPPAGTVPALEPSGLGTL
jgi:hypothetical protein